MCLTAGPLGEGKTRVNQICFDTLHCVVAPPQHPPEAGVRLLWPDLGSYKRVPWLTLLC